MKVSYRNYPALEKIHNGRFGATEYPIPEMKFFMGDEFKFFNEHFKKNAKYFASEINFLTDPFMDAVAKAGNKLLELFLEIIASKEKDLSYNGTFIESGGYTYALKYDFKKDIGVHFISLYWFDGNRIYGCYYCDDIPENAKIWISGDYKASYNIKGDKQEVKEASNIISRLIVYKLFKTYAEVETKHLLPNTVLREVECKYVNDTQLPITYLDSKWFTNLVKSDAFTVHGHFRLQACGKELRDHKLIWISEYIKTGYTSPARILNQN